MVDKCLKFYIDNYNDTSLNLKYDDDKDNLYKDFIYNKLFNLDYKSIIRLLFKIYKNSYRIFGINYLLYLFSSNLYDLEYKNVSIETYKQELHDSWYIL